MAHQYSPGYTPEHSVDPLWESTYWASENEEEDRKQGRRESRVLDAAAQQIPPQLQDDSSSEYEEGGLPRDKGPETATFDYAQGRGMVESDAKRFYEYHRKSATREAISASPVEVDPNQDGHSTSLDRHTGGMQRTIVSSGLGDTSAHNLDQLNARLGRFPGDNKYSSAAPPDDLSASSSQPSKHGFTHSPSNPGTVEQIPRSKRSMADSAPKAHHDRQIFESVNVDTPQPNSQVVENYVSVYEKVDKIIQLRKKYIALSQQNDNDNPKNQPDWKIYPPPPVPVWDHKERGLSVDAANAASAAKLQSYRKPGHDIGEDFNMDDLNPLPGEDSRIFDMTDQGVTNVYETEQDKSNNNPLFNIPTLKQYYKDLEKIIEISSDGPCKSFSFNRLQFLERKYALYEILNGYEEVADTKRVPHRDFYNVRKVDTHVHHSACMNQKHLLRFIKSKMKKHPDEKVYRENGEWMTLKEVFESINLTAYDLSIDTLDMHAHTDSFHRFDKFNLKYNPIGKTKLRTIFLKTDNDIKGKYLAEITKEVISDLEASKYQFVEWRLSIYGRSPDEWDKLAAWIVDNRLFSNNVRWLIQIPRLWDVFRASDKKNYFDNFERIVSNVFKPLFEVTKNPQSHPKLHVFLQRVVGFDSVDDESKSERRSYRNFPVARGWTGKTNPPYTYWIYYLYVNMASLNSWRKLRCFNTFVLRPHCGEAGDTEHLATAVLCCHSISHGLLLRKVPLLQYIFYLEQIGIAMSPLSNNALFLAYERNPILQYFRRGLNVSLSTDDPLQFAFTKEPLIEEYAVAAQILKLTAVDMCELAKHSVYQSGFEDSIKRHWLGDNYLLLGTDGNNVSKCNVPNIREAYRHETLKQELDMVERYKKMPETRHSSVMSMAAADIQASAQLSQPRGSANLAAAAAVASGRSSTSSTATVVPAGMAAAANAAAAAAATTAEHLLRSSSSSSIRERIAALGSLSPQEMSPGVSRRGSLAPASRTGSSPSLYGSSSSSTLATTMATATHPVRPDSTKNFQPVVLGDGPRIFPGLVSSRRRTSRDALAAVAVATMGDQPGGKGKDGADGGKAKDGADGGESKESS